jgi:hypothetical protein
MNRRITWDGCDQPGSGGAHVRTLRRSGQLPQVLEIVLGDLPEGLTRVWPEHHHQVPQVTGAVDGSQHVQLCELTLAGEGCGRAAER